MLRVASQWATPADPGISSQIVICLLFACDYLRYIVLQVCITQRAGEYRINCISLLILSIPPPPHCGAGNRDNFFGDFLNITTYLFVLEGPDLMISYHAHMLR